MASARPLEWGRSSAKDDGYRKCICAWLPNESSSDWLYDRVASAFEVANNIYGFKVDGIIEPLMAVSYETGHCFDWHVDIGAEVASTRKLSLSMLLSDSDAYTGGQLEFCALGTVGSDLRGGTAIVFPSFIAHRVTPVETGNRISLVAFAHGPAFA